MAREHLFGMGSTVTFHESAFTAQFQSLNWDGVTRAAFGRTHFGSKEAGPNQIGNAEFVPGRVVDPGNVTIPYNANGAVPPVHHRPEQITIALTSADSDDPIFTISGTGFITDVTPVTVPDPDAPADGSLTIKWTGPVDVAPAVQREA